MFGLKVIVKSDMVVDDGIDWSRVRSPSRALRRQKARKRHGFPHKYKPSPEIIQIGDVLFMHPAMLDSLRASGAVQ